MKKITIYKQRIPLMAEATDGINSGEIVIKSEMDFIHECVKEFSTCPFEQVKLNKLLLEINGKMEINKIIFKERE